eukprot:scaffold4071_cov217-Isochrysis_galbana.AAC.4
MARAVKQRAAPLVAGADARRPWGGRLAARQPGHPMGGMHPESLLLSHRPQSSEHLLELVALNLERVQARQQRLGLGGVELQLLAHCRLIYRGGRGPNTADGARVVVGGLLLAHLGLGDVGVRLERAVGQLAHRQIGVACGSGALRLGVVPAEASPCGQPLVVRRHLDGRVVDRGDDVLRLGREDSLIVPQLLQVLHGRVPGAQLLHGGLCQVKGLALLAKRALRRLARQRDPAGQLAGLPAGRKHRAELVPVTRVGLPPGTPPLVGGVAIALAREPPTRHLARGTPLHFGDGYSGARANHKCARRCPGRAPGRGQLEQRRRIAHDRITVGGRCLRRRARSDTG